jgi:microcompartment protein CcmL/EutN
MIEFNSIAVGIEAADHMVKAAQVEPLMMKTICPGKFVVAVFAEVASVQSAVDAGLASGKDTVVDHFVIANIDTSVISAISCAVDKVSGAAIGVIETFSAASAILAADTAVKTASVDLIEVRIAMGVGGKAFCILSGDVGPVEMAVNAGAATAGENGMLVRKVVIPSMSQQVLRHIM